MPGRVGVDGFSQTAMHRQISLLVTRQAQRHHRHVALHILLGRGGQNVALADLDAAGEPDLH